MAGLCFCCFALVLFFPFPSDQIGGGFLVCYFFSSLSLLLFVFFGCSDGMEREACVCDHGYERSDLCAEIIIIITTTFRNYVKLGLAEWIRAGCCCTGFSVIFEDPC